MSQNENSSQGGKIAIVIVIVVVILIVVGVVLYYLYKKNHTDVWYACVNGQCTSNGVESDTLGAVQDSTCGDACAQAPTSGPGSGGSPYPTSGTYTYTPGTSGTWVGTFTFINKLNGWTPVYDYDNVVSPNTFSNIITNNMPQGSTPGTTWLSGTSPAPKDRIGTGLGNQVQTLLSSPFSTLTVNQDASITLS